MKKGMIRCSEEGMKVEVVWRRKNFSVGHAEFEWS